MPEIAELVTEPALSVVIPAYNEEGRLGGTLDLITRYLRGRNHAWEVVVVDDGSRDGTVVLAQAYAEKEPHVRVIACGENRGKGHAVKVGFMESRGDLVLFSDADCSTPIEELAKLERAVGAGAHVAVGSRALADSDVRVRQGLLRQTMGKTFNKLVWMATGLGLHDTQCGFKLFRREAMLPAFRAQRLDGFAFDVELLFLAKRMGLSVAEIPVAWVNSPDSRVHVVRDSARMLRDILKIRWNAIVGEYAELPRPA